MIAVENPGYYYAFPWMSGSLTAMIPQNGHLTRQIFTEWHFFQRHNICPLGKFIENTIISVLIHIQRKLK
jgi:hypothetical protein